MNKEQLDKFIKFNYPNLKTEQEISAKREQILQLVKDVNAFDITNETTKEERQKAAQFLNALLPYKTDKE
jgi:hypothetical protein